MEEASRYVEVPAPATAAQYALSDEADSSDSIPGPPTRALTPVADQPNRWCVDGRYQAYSEAKLLNDKGVMTQTLTLRGGSLREVSRLCQRSTISSTDIDLSGECVRWAIIVKSWSESSTPLTWLLSNHRLIGGLPPPNRPH